MFMRLLVCTYEVGSTIDLYYHLDVTLEPEPCAFRLSCLL